MKQLIRILPFCLLPVSASFPAVSNRLTHTFCALNGTHIYSHSYLHTHTLYALTFIFASIYSLHIHIHFCCRGCSCIGFLPTCFRCHKSVSSKSSLFADFWIYQSLYACTYTYTHTHICYLPTLSFSYLFLFWFA